MYVVLQASPIMPLLRDEASFTTQPILCSLLINYWRITPRCHPTDQLRHRSAQGRIQVPLIRIILDLKSAAFLTAIGQYCYGQEEWLLLFCKEESNGKICSLAQRSVSIPQSKAAGLNKICRFVPIMLVCKDGDSTVTYYNFFHAYTRCRGSILFYCLLYDCMHLIRGDGRARLRLSSTQENQDRLVTLLHDFDYFHAYIPAVEG